MSKANRVGILVTAISVVILLFGIMSGGWGYGASSVAETASTLGLLGTVFGYALTRLWFWCFR